MAFFLTSPSKFYRMSFPVASGSGTASAAKSNAAVAPMFGGSAKGRNASNGNEEATAYELPW